MMPASRGLAFQEGRRCKTSCKPASKRCISTRAINRFTLPTPRTTIITTRRRDIVAGRHDITTSEMRLEQRYHVYCACIILRFLFSRCLTRPGNHGTPILMMSTRTGACCGGNTSRCAISSGVDLRLHFCCCAKASEDIRSARHACRARKTALHFISHTNEIKPAAMLLASFSRAFVIKRLADDEMRSSVTCVAIGSIIINLCGG